jgi:hypothetical protein
MAAADKAREVHDTRFTFVEVLLALAVGEIATRVAALVRSGEALAVTIHGYAHLLLFTLVIATSWVHWRSSSANPTVGPVTQVFSRGFVVLLLDVVIAIVYFVGVGRAEAPRSPGGVRDEAFILGVIFLLYAGWDGLARRRQGGGKRNELLGLFWCMSASLAGAAILFLLVVLAPRFLDPWAAAFWDLAMLAVVLGYRGLKQRRKLP